MRRQYTVSWSPSAERRLAELWVENPLIKQEITRAADEIDAALAHEPNEIGIPTSARARLVCRPPLSVLFLTREPDRQVRVIFVKLWDD